MGLGLEGLTWTAAYSEGSRRDLGWRTLVVEVVVVVVRLHCFFAGRLGCPCHGSRDEILLITLAAGAFSNQTVADPTHPPARASPQSDLNPLA